MTFNDLKFETHKSFPSLMSHARIELPNGNGLSVVNGDFAYCDANTYEIAPLRDGNLFTIDDWCDQVRGYVTEDQITEILQHMENDTPEEYKDFLEGFFKG